LQNSLLAPFDKLRTGFDTSKDQGHTRFHMLVEALPRLPACSANRLALFCYVSV